MGSDLSFVHCPLCGSPYVGGDRTVSIAMRNEQVTLSCPRCEKLFPGHLEGDLKNGKLVFDQEYIKSRSPLTTFCVFCGSSFGGSGGNITLRLREGIFRIKCPRCDREMPGEEIERPRGLVTGHDLMDSFSETLKASHSESPKENTSCFVATVCFGSSSAPEVMPFRSFRDRVMLPSFLGRRLVRLYYLISPSLESYLRLHARSKDFVRDALLKPLAKIVSRKPKHLSQREE